jgi:3,4-dihydroxy 2-butanone 4-phosphate synthase/GTP cyclohydrolase II
MQRMLTMNIIEQAVEDIKNGKLIVLVDDWSRENEGDIVIAAEQVTEENLAFCIKKASGLMCIPCSGTILDMLELPAMVKNSTDRNGTPFTVSVDAAFGTSTGMPVCDRVKTVQVFLNPDAKPEELTRPGHMFPLRPRDGLLTERRGHTEASIELMRLAGLKPVCVIVEIINENGSMARGETLDQFAIDPDMLMISVQDLYQYIYQNESN